MQQSNLTDDDFLIEFDNLVNSTLSRINYNITDSSELKIIHDSPIFDSISSVSSNSSISSVNSTNYTRVKDNNHLQNIVQRDISLNSNSFYTGSKFQSNHTKVDKENLQTTNNNNNTKISVSGKSLVTFKNTKSKSDLNHAENSPDNGQPDNSGVYHFSERENYVNMNRTNMCSSMIQETSVSQRNNFCRGTKKKQRLTLTKNKLKGNKPLNIGFLPSLLNDLIQILVKYLNKSIQSKPGKKNSHTNRIDTKCIKLMNKKVKAATLYNCLTQMVTAKGSPSKKSTKTSLQNFLLSILIESSSDPLRRPSLSNKSKKLKPKRIYSPSITSMSNDSSLTTSDSSIFMEEDVISQNLVKQTTSLDQSSNDLSESESNDQKWHNQLEIPNIEDPLLFIDTLYNQLLANNHTEIKEDEILLRHSLSSSHNTSFSSSLNNSFTDLRFESTEKTDELTQPDLTLNDDQLSCISMNNELSLIDYSYLIANHGPPVTINDNHIVHDYVKMNPNIVDWNYEDETTDFNDMSFNSGMVDRTESNVDGFSVDQDETSRIQENVSTTNLESINQEKDMHYDWPDLRQDGSQESFEKSPIISTQTRVQTSIDNSEQFLVNLRPPISSELMPTTVENNFLSVSPLLSLSSPSLSVSSYSSKEKLTTNYKRLDRNFYSCTDASASTTASEYSPYSGVYRGLGHMISDGIGASRRNNFLNGLLVPITSVANGQNCTSTNLVRDNDAAEKGCIWSFVENVVNSVKNLMVSKNVVVILPIIFILLNSKFKSGPNLSNTICRVGTAAAVVSLKSVSKNN